MKSFPKIILDAAAGNRKERAQMKYEPIPGQHIHQAAAGAIEMAKQNRREVEFSFNGIRMYVNPDYNVVQQTVIYNLMMDLERLKK